MVLFFITLLAVSVVGLAGLIGLKRWELTTGRVFLGGLRPAAGELLSRGLHFVEAKAPALVRRGARELLQQGSVLAHRTVAWVVLVAERLLERVLHLLRGATRPGDASQASAFLREVAEHKKSLIKKASRSKKRNVIYDE